MPLIDLVDIFTTARDFRARAGLVGPPYSTHKLMEAVFPDILVTGRTFPIEVLEAVRRTNDGTTIFYNRAVNNDARRVGIAHGMAHVHFGDLNADAENECGVSFGSIRRVPLHEQRADLLAGELLTPLLELDVYFRDVKALFPRKTIEKHALDDMVDRCSSLFQVPSGFIRWRLYDLQALRRSHFNV